MPALQRIIPSQGKEFWDALDPDNTKQVLEAVKEEVSLCTPIPIAFYPKNSDFQVFLALPKISIIV
jgi:hypothetical protein